jgi:hypothetical protein
MLTIKTEFYLFVLFGFITDVDPIGACVAGSFWVGDALIGRKSDRPFPPCIRKQLGVHLAHGAHANDTNNGLFLFRE